MAITLYATHVDVRNAYEGTILDNLKANTRLDFLLRQASAKLARLVPSLDRRMASGMVDPEVPAGMVVTAVLRVWRNPAGATQQGVGPFQLTFNDSAKQNEIVFDPADIKTLLAESGKPRSFQLGLPAHRNAVDGLVDAGGYPRLRITPPGT